MTIDRLPFPRPDDPLLQARRDRAGGRAFSLVDLPRAATLLAQGAGRLIRNAEDRGVVAVLDPRLATASYRGVLLSTLPPMRRTVDRSEVESFLRRALEGARPREALGRYAAHSAKSKRERCRSWSRVPAVATRDDPAAGDPAQLVTVERVGALVRAHVADDEIRPRSGPGGGARRPAR